MSFSNNNNNNNNDNDNMGESPQPLAGLATSFSIYEDEGGPSQASSGPMPSTQSQMEVNPPSDRGRRSDNAPPPVTSGPLQERIFDNAQSQSTEEMSESRYAEYAFLSASPITASRDDTLRQPENRLLDAGHLDDVEGFEPPLTGLTGQPSAKRPRLLNPNQGIDPESASSSAKRGRTRRGRAVGQHASSLAPDELSSPVIQAQHPRRTRAPDPPANFPPDFPHYKVHGQDNYKDLATWLLKGKYIISLHETPADETPVADLERDYGIIIVPFGKERQLFGHNMGGRTAAEEFREGLMNNPKMRAAYERVEALSRRLFMEAAESRLAGDGNSFSSSKENVDPNLEATARDRASPSEIAGHGPYAHGAIGGDEILPSVEGRTPVDEALHIQQLPQHYSNIGIIDYGAAGFIPRGTAGSDDTISENSSDPQMHNRASMSLGVPATATVAQEHQQQHPQQQQESPREDQRQRSPEIKREPGVETETPPPAAEAATVHTGAQQQQSQGTPSVHIKTKPGLTPGHAISVHSSAHPSPQPEASLDSSDARGSSNKDFIVVGSRPSPRLGPSQTIAEGSGQLTAKKRKIIWLSAGSTREQRGEPSNPPAGSLARPKRPRLEISDSRSIEGNSSRSGSNVITSSGIGPSTRRSNRRSGLIDNSSSGLGEPSYGNNPRSSFNDSPSPSQPRSRPRHPAERDDDDERDLHDDEDEEMEMAPPPKTRAKGKGKASMEAAAKRPKRGKSTAMPSAAAKPQGVVKTTTTTTRSGRTVKATAKVLEAMEAAEVETVGVRRSARRKAAGRK
ncbi:hypothetical protein B0T17DRAFT_511610 [Bombardia bombarda]|uniref:Uncharacterized protein n=1 Tax=Bombardia bombarda TaxID=252184 RepID=A0AA39WAQ0_9PEZI|nr:hypothetical protein B0T17DRAFT_511610 [Bombardia bombarda]